MNSYLTRLRGKLSTVCILLMLSACSSETTTTADDNSQQSAAPTETASIAFVDTQSGAPIKIDPALFDTAAAKSFLKTGKNDYIGNEAAIKRGKKVFQLYSCTQCHGATAGGQIGPALTGPSFKYPKNATNKGMFETIWSGTNGGMGAKGLGLMSPDDPTVGISPDEMLKIIAWVRSMSGDLTGNE